DAISGPASSTASRSDSGSVTAPPEESWTLRSVEDRNAATVSRSRPRSSVGFAAASRMWTCTTLAPTASHSLAVATSSSRVTGSAGTSALADSAPVGATVINVVVVMRSAFHAAGLSSDSGLDGRGRRAHPQRRVVGDVLLHHGQGDRAQLVMVRRRTDEADGTAIVGRYRRTGRGQLVGADAVEVQQDQLARRPAQVVHQRDRLLPAVAALVQV